MPDALRISWEGENHAEINLSGANLSGADLMGSNMDRTDRSNLTGIVYLGVDVFGNPATGTPTYDALTGFTGAWSGSRCGGGPGPCSGSGETPFDPVAAGWTFVPESSTALLLGLGLMATTRVSGR